MRSPVLAILPVLALAATSPAVDRCAAATRATGYACLATPGGVVLATDPADLARLAGHAAEGEARWHRHFSGTTSPYAVVEPIGPGMTTALHAAGYPVVLPWLSPAQYAAASTDSIRRGAEAQAKAQGVTDPAKVTALTDRAISAWHEKHPPSDWLEKEAGGLPHEIGHLWYIKRYWPNANADGAGHYGGPGPDWMDETAAVLMEDDRGAETRRKQFDAYFANTDPASAADRATLSDLDTFFHRDHPAKAMQELIAARAAASAGPRVIVVSAEEARNQVGKAALFYLQARVFADYLIARSGNPAIFDDIGLAFGRGETIEAWLASRGGHWQLGQTIGELQADWSSWVATRHG